MSDITESIYESDNDQKLLASPDVKVFQFHERLKLLEDRFDSLEQYLRQMVKDSQKPEK